MVLEVVGDDCQKEQREELVAERMKGLEEAVVG